MTVKKPNTAIQTGAYMLRTVIRTLLYVAAALAIIRGASWAYGFGFSIFSNQTMAADGAGHEVYVTVEEGDTIKQVAKTLKKEKLIKDELVFEIQEKMSRYKDELKPGLYILRTDQTAEEMMAILSGNDTKGQPQNEAVRDEQEGKGS